MRPVCVSLVPALPLRPAIHLAFAATDFAQVEGFHRAGPDPDGHEVEAVWHAPPGAGIDLAC